MNRKIVAFIALCFLYSTAYPQNKIEFDMGVGFLEALSLKVKYGEKIQLGIGQGFVGKFPFQTTIELYNHLEKKNELHKRMSFYLMGGIGSTFLSKGYNNGITDFYSRFGLTLRFSNRTGINFDIGPSLWAMKDTDDTYSYMFVPSAGIHFYFKI